MKRDWDVVRDVLLKVEAIPPEERGKVAIAADEGGDLTEPEHAALLCGAGFIDGRVIRPMNGRPHVMILSLTWQGYELLDTIRSKTVWERIKATAQEKGVDLTFDAVKAIAPWALKAVPGT
jgi:hypothetical protein